MKKIKKVMWILLAVVTILFAAKSLLKLKMNRPTPAAEPVQVETENEVSAYVEPVGNVVPSTKDETLDVRKYTIEKLVAHGWTHEAADAVWVIHEEFFSRMAELNIHDLDAELVGLYRLGSPEIQAKLVRNPEFTNLLCTVMDTDPDGPRNILNTIPLAEEEKVPLITLYQLNATADDLASIAALLQNPEWRNRIVQLIRKTPQNVEMIRYFRLIQSLQDEAPQVADVYEDWLFGILDEYLSVEPDSDRAAELQTFLTVFSQPIVREMKRNSGLCAGFSECWRDFESILTSLDLNDEKNLNNYKDLNIFRFLYEYRDEQALELYNRFGIYGVDILMSPTFLNPDARAAREKLVQFLLTFSDSSQKAILKTQPQKYPGIVRLLTRGFPDDYYDTMFLLLAEANQGRGEHAGNTGGLISYWCGLSDSALEKELGLYDPGLIQFVPGYDVYSLCEKSLQGRNVSGWDWAFAGVDAAFLVVDVATLGSGAAITSTVSTSGKGAKTVVKGTNVALKGATKITAAEVKQNSLLTFRVLKQTNQFLAKQTTQMAKGMDISKLVKYSFENSGVGRETFKRWTGMEPRIFMRGDRKVLIHLERVPETQAGKLARNIMGDMAIGCGLVMAVQTDTGQQIIRGGKEFVEDPKEVTLMWKKNLAMWWRLNQN